MDDRRHRATGGPPGQRITPGDNRLGLDPDRPAHPAQSPGKRANVIIGQALGLEPVVTVANLLAEITAGPQDTEQPAIDFPVPCASMQPHDALLSDRFRISPVSGRLSE
jgi:hypothetical protein